MKYTNKTLLSTELKTKILLEIVYATSNQKRSNNTLHYHTDNLFSGFE